MIQCLWITRRSGLVFSVCGGSVRLQSTWEQVSVSVQVWFQSETPSYSLTFFSPLQPQTASVSKNLRFLFTHQHQHLLLPNCRTQTPPRLSVRNKQQNGNSKVFPPPLKLLSVKNETCQETWLRSVEFQTESRKIVWNKTTIIWSDSQFPRRQWTFQTNKHLKRPDENSFLKTDRWEKNRWGVTFVWVD